MKPALNITLIVSLSLLLLANIVVAVTVLRKRKKLRTSDAGGKEDLLRLLVSHADEFEGLYESLYVSVSGDDFDADAYEEWCGRAAASSDEEFRNAFEKLFSKTDDIKRCMEYSKDLLDLIGEAGIVRTGRPGEEFVYDQNKAELFECINLKDPTDNNCTVVKPAWVCGGKVVEPGVVTADP